MERWTAGIGRRVGCGHRFLHRQRERLAYSDCHNVTAAVGECSRARPWSTRTLPTACAGWAPKNVRVPSKIYIGTAGWSLPRMEQRHFPAGESLLTRYAGVLPAVEINSTFYRPHRAATFERWAASVPRS